MAAKRTSGRDGMELAILICGNTVPAAFKWGAVGFGFWCAKEAFTAGAGKETALRGFDWIATAVASESHCGFWMATTAVIFLAWYMQRDATRRTIKHLAPANAGRERELDPDRTSSNLLPDGQSRPEDF